MFRFVVASLLLVPVAAALPAAPVRKAAAAPRPPHSPGQAEPAPAVAFSPNGKLLAVAGYGKVTLLETATGKPTAVLAPHEGSVTGVQFSPDGTRLAASAGQPGKAGEIRVWDLQTRAARVLRGLHTDTVLEVAWSPDGRSLAACSYDRLVSVWDLATGTGLPLKDHTDAVYSVAWSPDGRRLASASGDRIVKVWDVESGKRLFTLGDATAELYSVAFHPSGTEVAAVGVDRMLRKWSLAGTSGTLLRSAFAHDAAILRVLYTPDGAGIYTTSEDRSVRLWDAQTLLERRVFEKQPDWGMGLARAADNTLLAVSRYDGTVALYEAASGKRRLQTLRATR